MAETTTTDAPKLLRSTSMFGLSDIANTHEDEGVTVVHTTELRDLEQIVLNMISKASLVHDDRLAHEVSWFFRHLGLHPTYFASIKPREIAQHITALYASKVLYAMSPEGSLSLRLRQESHDGALYMVPSQLAPGVTPPSLEIERHIEREFLREGLSAPATDIGHDRQYRIQVYRTANPVTEGSDTKIRLFLVRECHFVPDEGTGLAAIADKRFIANASSQTQDVMAELVTKAAERLGPVVQVMEVDCKDGKEVRIMVAYHKETTQAFFSGLTELYRSHNLHSTRKYVETYKNGMRSFSCYLYGDNCFETAQAVATELSLLYVLPHLELQGQSLSVPANAYSFVACKFVHQFLSSVDEDEFQSLSQSLSAQMIGILSKVRAGLKRETMTEDRIESIAYGKTNILVRLFKHFCMLHEPGKERDADAAKKEEQLLLSMIRKEATSELEVRIFSSMVVFNVNVLKTNFFKRTKVAMSFRLDPSFLSAVDYPTTPFAVFFVVGSEFRGFHVRFVDVARGGIRVIRSRNTAAFSANVSTLFDENYNLALTQQLKNKDIPEGGSKGTILLSGKHQDKAFVAFQKYVDSVLDLLLLPDDEIVDHYGKTEVLFLGPDEGTADFMNWASEHARSRAYPYWRSFTTGKSRSIGGIPHDHYGMTTRSIHQYVLGILEKLGLQEENIKKLQTGGPDGDLGSNEIKISKDKTVAIVDGSGVLYDPEGINREELFRLATARQMISEFNMTKLSGKGSFRVLVDDVDVTLPSGRVVEKGLLFRNTFHLETEMLSGIDLFVPCGGRPAAVDRNNVHFMFNDAGQPIFQYVVEGANLFFTQDARLEMEKKGVVLFKDASANKGGVTSSSLEVLAGLALNDEEFEKHMMVTDPDNPPEFYGKYVQDVIKIIETRARAEFEKLWEEKQQSPTPICTLTDILSQKINDLNKSIVESQLWNDEKLKKKVIQEAVPPCLVDLIGLDTLLQRVPENYLKAIFGAYLACKFVYGKHSHSGEFGFFMFMQEYAV